jgi:hypothetical protein
LSAAESSVIPFSPCAVCLAGDLRLGTRRRASLTTRFARSLRRPSCTRTRRAASTPRWSNVAFMLPHCALLKACVLSLLQARTAAEAQEKLSEELDQLLREVRLATFCCLSRLRRCSPELWPCIVSGRQPCAVSGAQGSVRCVRIRYSRQL